MMGRHDVATYEKKKAPGSVAAGDPFIGQIRSDPADLAARTAAVQECAATIAADARAATARGDASRTAVAVLKSPHNVSPSLPNPKYGADPIRVHLRY
jgi:hypothetical protein